jgi:hypothetical protein
MIRWFLLIPFVLLVAIGTASVFFLVASLVDPVMATLTGNTLFVGFWSLIDALNAADDPAPILEEAFFGVSRLFFTLLVVPPVFVALVGELVGTRSLLWYAGGAALVTAAIPWILRGSARVASPAELHVAAVLALTGAVAGFIYWLLAGQGAGHRSAPYRADADRILSAKTENRPAKE